MEGLITAVLALEDDTAPELGGVGSAKVDIGGSLNDGVGEDSVLRFCCFLAYGEPRVIVDPVEFAPVPAPVVEGGGPGAGAGACVAGGEGTTGGYE